MRIYKGFASYFFYGVWKLIFCKIVLLLTRDIISFCQELSLENPIFTYDGFVMRNDVSIYNAINIFYM